MVKNTINMYELACDHESIVEQDWTKPMEAWATAWIIIMFALVVTTLST